MARKSRISAAILSLMGEGVRHAWSLEELQSGLGEREVAADFSSVFRAADRLALDGVIRKLVLPDGRARFELAAAHHDHLQCTRCGELVAVPCAFDAAVFAAVEAASGVAIAEHSIVFRGLCRSCRAFAESEARV